MNKTLLFTTFSVLIVMLLSCGNPSNTDDDHDSVIDADGNVYKTIKIGNQWWMAENLRTTKYNDGSAIPNIADSVVWINDTLGAYCYYNNTTDADSIKKFGALYNWYAVDTKKLAPIGWHVPDTSEWTELENYLIVNGYNWDGTTSGNKIGKSMAAKTDWITSNEEGNVGNNLSTNNSSGFSALPGGFRYRYTNFYNQGFHGYWWSTTEFNDSEVYNRFLRYDYEPLLNSFSLKLCGFSVRLVKD